MAGTFTVAAAPVKGVPALDGVAHAKFVTLPPHANAASAVTGVLSPKAFSAPALEFNLADGQQITAELQRVARDDQKATQTWVGTFADSPGSMVVITKSKGVVAGYGSYKDQTFEVLPSAGGKHVLFTVDPARVPKADNFKHNVGAAADVMSTTADYGVGAAAALDAANAVVHDVLILYTSNAAAKWGQATLQSMIHAGVQAANQAYVNSQVGLTLNVVGIQQAPMSEATGMAATVDRLKNNSTVRSLRDTLAADMVVLVNENSDYCGYATLWYSYSGSYTNWDAYAGVNSSCLSQQVIAHEVGHLQQLDHNRENATGLAAYAYSYGYRLCTADGFRDIMSYPCSTGGSTRLSYFSNPNLTYNGYPIGISYEASPTKAADSARSLNNTATLVASYRVGSSSSTVTVPMAPSAMTVQGAAYNQVALTWTDNSSNETGFKLERSPDGVTFVEIASLGAGARSFTDASVAASTRYSYRVRAYNSAGASSYSNAATVTTPSTPPSAPVAPTSVAATNNGDGSANVMWTTGSSTATSFEVRRSKYDARKKVWSAPAIAATVPASTLTILDSTGAGLFRYTVRAINSGGASSNAGPAEVAVTSPTNSKRKQQRR